MPSIRKKIDRWILLNSSVKLTEKLFFTENLRVMVKAGLSMSEALNTLALQAESKMFRRIISELKGDVESGKLLSAGLIKFPKTFPEIFVRMVQVGEISGTLEDVLHELGLQMKKDHRIRSKVKGAMTYPIVILVAMTGITTGLVTFVLPKLLSIFKEFGDVKLPLATRVLIFITDAVQNHGLLMAVSILVTAATLILLARTTRGRAFVHNQLLRLPILGPIVKKVNLARFSRTVAGLLTTDVPVVESLKITSAVLRNVHYREAVVAASERIKTGDTISATLSAYPKLFPPLVVQMVYVGERSGNVDELLGEVAEFYESQVDDVLDNLSSIIEPILILILGAMVGGIALAVITPMFALTESIAAS